MGGRLAQQEGKYRGEGKPGVFEVESCGAQKRQIDRRSKDTDRNSTKSTNNLVMKRKKEKESTLTRQTVWERNESRERKLYTARAIRTG